MDRLQTSPGMRPKSHPWITKVERTERMPDLEGKTIHRRLQKMDETPNILNENVKTVNETVHFVQRFIQSFQYFIRNLND